MAGLPESTVKLEPAPAVSVTVYRSVVSINVAEPTANEINGTDRCVDEQVNWCWIPEAAAFCEFCASFWALAVKLPPASVIGVLLSEGFCRNGQMNLAIRSAGKAKPLRLPVGT